MANASSGIEWKTLSEDSVRSLLGHQPAPCLSLYLPTHRNVPENRVDRPRYRHLVESLELALALARPRAEVERLLHPFRVLDGDRAFWEHTHDGLAIFAADGLARGFVLERPVAPLALVTNHFHVLPLVRLAAALERWTVLALTSRAAIVYAAEAWHDLAGGPAARELAIVRLEPLPLSATEPRTRLVRGDVVDEEIREPHRVSLGKGPAGRAKPQVIRGGAGSKQDDIDKDTEIFLRHVDAVVETEVSRPMSLPLMLVAAAPLAATFRKISRNPWLVEEHVPRDGHLLSRDELAALVAPHLAALHLRRVERELHAVEQARGRGRLLADLAEIGRAAVAGRIATLYVEADRFEPGHFDRETGCIERTNGEQADLSLSGGQPASGFEDVLGSLAETVLETGGGVVIVAAAALSARSGAAAICRS
ncbi:MAG: hypothetical protein WD072_09515 [Pirellulales bacterium]